MCVFRPHPAISAADIVYRAARLSQRTKIANDGGSSPSLGDSFFCSDSVVLAVLYRLLKTEA